MTADLILLVLCVVIAGFGLYYVPRIFRRTKQEEALERAEAPHRELADVNRFLGLLEDVKTPEELDRIVPVDPKRKRRAD